MSEVGTIGLDLAKNVFQAHGSDASGAVLFRKKLRRDHVLRFLAAQPACTVAMEAYAGGHYWAREIVKLGHDVRLIAPGNVKPFAAHAGDRGLGQQNGAHSVGVDGVEILAGIEKVMPTLQTLGSVKQSPASHAQGRLGFAAAEDHLSRGKQAGHIGR